MSSQVSRCPTCGSAYESEEPRDANIHVSLAAATRHGGLLASNEAPLEADLIVVKSMISKADERLLFLATEISRLQEWLKPLEDERDTLRNFRIQNKAILSPLRRIPPEILIEIFSWTLPSVREALAGGGLDVGRSPWVLGQISSSWRAAALSTPSLWSLVVIDYAVSSWCPPLMLETQIRRARSRSLKIHFYGYQQSDSRPQIAIFRSLAEHSSSWEELSVGLTSDMVPVLATLQNRIPSLRRLWITWDDSESPAAVGSIDVFHTAPSLVDVGIYNNYRHVPILLPAHQLTRYQLDAPWTVHAGLLKLAPNLVEARITDAFDDEGPWPEQGDIINIGLPKLQRLCVSHAGILRYLKTPALQEIVLRWYEDDPHLLSDLDSFVVRSSCSLRRICLSPDISTVSEILHKYPSITELVILAYSRSEDENAQGEGADTLVSHLTIPTGGAAVAPQLRAIEFGCKCGTSIDCALYLKMLESRWGAQNCTLNSAALLTDSASGPDPVTLGGLRSLHKDGLDLLLLHGGQGADVMRHWTYNARWT
ncbi:hypothetical protein FB451DRAFT_1555395 [Mycena latifolia]|nr:hypothetical protein FB451DRAFT_1555395 [Mycena latifolia]